MRTESRRDRGQRLYNELCEKKGAKITLVDLYKFYKEGVISSDDIYLINHFMLLAGI